MAPRPVSADRTAHLVRLQQTGHGEDVADVVIDNQHALVGQQAGGIVQAVEHFLLGRGQCRDGTMQEEGRLVDQPLGGTNVFEDHRLPEPLEVHLLLLAELLGGVNDHRHFGETRFFGQFVDQVESLFVGKLQPGDDQVHDCARDRAATASASAAVLTPITCTSPPPTISERWSRWESLGSISRTQFCRVRDKLPDPQERLIEGIAQSAPVC